MRRTGFRIILCFVAVSLIATGCNQKQPAPTAPASSTSDPQPDIGGERRGVDIAYFDADNPYTKHVRGEVEKRGDVRFEVERLSTLGYTADLSSASVTEGTNQKGQRYQMSVMGFHRSNKDDVVYVFAMDGPQHDFTYSARVSFTAALAGAGAIEIEPGVWFEPLGTMRDTDLSQTAWNWREWGACVGAVFINSALQCARGCATTGPGYLHCLGVCGGFAALGAILSCSFFQAI